MKMEMTYPRPYFRISRFVGYLFGFSIANGFILNAIQQDQIQRMGNIVKRCGNIPGMSLAVVHGGDSWTLPMGVVSEETRERVTVTTKFGIGSLTKAFTSTLMVMLLRESKQGYTLDTPLKDILQEEHLFPDAIRSSQATITDILSHRMGLARADLALFAGYPDTFTLDHLARFLSCLPVKASFRDRYLYSNFMYNLAGHVIEKLANQSYSEALKSRLLAPLRMTSTLTHYNIADVNDTMAQPYLTLQGELIPTHHSLFNLKQFLPSLGLASNAHDMVEWMKFQLSPYRRLNEVTAIPTDVIVSTHRPVIPHINNLLKPMFPAPDLTFAYGLGWHQAVYKGFRRIWHSGTLFGYTSFIWLYPDLDIGIFVAVNGPARMPDTRNRLNAFLYYVSDMLLGDHPWLGQSSICFYPSPVPIQWPERSQQTYSNEDSKILDYCIDKNITFSKDISYEEYTGTYYNKLFGTVRVYLTESDNGSLSLLSSKCPLPLGILFGQRFQGVLLLTSTLHHFEMKPTGLFEFSAHSVEDELSTMPVEFFDFDFKGSPNSLKAVWQTVEIIQFSRNSKDGKCFGPISNTALSIHLTLIDIFAICKYLIIHFILIVSTL